MGGDRNTVHISSPPTASKSWPPQSKDEVARALVARIADTLARSHASEQGRASHDAAAARRRPAAAGVSERTRRRARPGRRRSGRRAGHDRAGRARRDPDRNLHRAAARDRRTDPAALRTGAAARRHRAQLRRARSMPTIAAKYRSILVNLGDALFTVERGTRIAQLVVAATMQVQICEVANLG